MLVLETARATYYADDDGRVLARTNGPRGWSYSGKWQIVGFKTRWNARRTVPLADALDGADIGHAFVVDLDHGTRRVWGMERAQTIRRAEPFDVENAERMMRPEPAR